jgi:hypothetical protein
VTAVPVTLTVHDQQTTAMTVVLTITAPSGVAPSTVTMTLIRSARLLNFGWIFAGSLIVGAAVLVAFRRFRNTPEPLAPVEGTPAPDAKVIYTESTFTFSGSWATSISAVVTVVATAFTATDVLKKLVPGVDTTFFLAVTIVYGIVLSLGPLVYSALEQPVTGHTFGTKRGFRIAATITAIAVGGQLSTVGALVWLSDLNTVGRLAGLVFLGVVAALVVFYTEMTRRQLWQLRPPPPAATAPVKPMSALV